jgi:hypothetical protein
VLEAQTVKVPETDTAVLAMQVLIPVTLVGNVGAEHDVCTPEHTEASTPLDKRIDEHFWKLCWHTRVLIEFKQLVAVLFKVATV